MKLRPRPGDATFRGQKTANKALQNTPFLDKFFLKATDLALAILDTYGAPTLKGLGSTMWEQVQGRQGVVYFEDMWQTKTEKIHSALGIVDTKSGDHIDLFTGAVLEIVTDRNVSHAYFVNAKTVWFWETAGR